MKKILGILILLAVAAGVIIATQMDWGSLQRAAPVRQDWVDVSIFYGGEKSRFLANPQTQKTLEKYKVRLNAAKAGSIEMATQLPTEGKDCLWPSNQIAVELARQAGKPVLADTNIFNSPMVFYAWRPVTEAFIKAGAAKRENGVISVDTAKLVELVQQQKRWKEDLGLDVYGALKIFSTDPRNSNSGNMWAGLLANTLNNGNVASAADLLKVLPAVQAYFRAMGYMEHSSGDIFENFLKQGMGARPIIVGYENQLVEFVIEHQEYRDVIRDKIDILYPTPTVFGSHPLISLTGNCKRLETALQDQGLQALAWKEHGFRSGLLGVSNSPDVLNVGGIPETVNQVMPLPEATVMKQIIDALE
ncbi:MAG: substrate-binding domain-containing protein [Thiothrix sp.]